MNLFFDLTHFKELGQNYRNILVRFLVQIKTLKFGSEINWPLLNWYFLLKKNQKDSDNFWHRKLTLKVRNQHFLIDWFRTYVDLRNPISFFFMKKCYFSLNYAIIWCRSCWKILECDLVWKDKLLFSKCKVERSARERQGKKCIRLGITHWYVFWKKCTVKSS